MLPPQKVIAFDLDGTLAASKCPITQEMAGLISELMKQKIVVVISGGNFKQFKTQFLPCFQDSSLFTITPNLILLPTSGTQRYQFDKTKKDWYCIDSVPFSRDIKEKARKFLEDIITSGGYDIPKNPKGEIIEDRDTQLTFSALGQMAPIEEKILWDPDQKKRQKIKAEIEPKLPEATIIIGGTTTLDIVPAGFNKSVGLIRLLDNLGFKKEDMLFVGDGIFPGGNDYSAYEAGLETIKVSGPEETGIIIKEWIKK